MFYSQFILAKKGPLGTIWIAAHLERKLRRNQVAETNIGVTVDSILFPEVPIALRLSGHLLLGVVRIYSRQVNYLFNDCSETLGKIKQAINAAAVDLPPEETTAPFHTITLPETFDFDELELGQDSESSFLHFNGNYVDHHVSSREQITLQDCIENNPYLGSSQFGLDERFGDGDYAALDLDFDEDFLTGKAPPPPPAPPAPSTSTCSLKDTIVLPDGCGNEAVCMDIDDPREPLGLGLRNVDLNGQGGDLIQGHDHEKDPALATLSDPVNEPATTQVVSKTDSLGLHAYTPGTPALHVYTPGTPAFHAFTPRALEACTPDLNQEYCPPDEPSTPALAEEASLLVYKETLADGAGKAVSSTGGISGMSASLECGPGGLLVQQGLVMSTQTVGAPNPPPFHRVRLEQAALAELSGEQGWVVSTQTVGALKPPSFHGFPLQQAALPELNREQDLVASSHRLGMSNIPFQGFALQRAAPVELGREQGLAPNLPDPPASGGFVLPQACPAEINREQGWALSSQTVESPRPQGLAFNLPDPPASGGFVLPQACPAEVNIEQGWALSSQTVERPRSPPFQGLPLQQAATGELSREHGPGASENPSPSPFQGFPLQQAGLIQVTKELGWSASTQQLGAPKPPPFQGIPLQQAALPELGKDHSWAAASPIPPPFQGLPLQQASYADVNSEALPTQAVIVKESAAMAQRFLTTHLQQSTADVLQQAAVLPGGTPGLSFPPPRTELSSLAHEAFNSWASESHQSPATPRQEVSLCLHGQVPSVLLAGQVGQLRSGPEATHKIHGLDAFGGLQHSPAAQGNAALPATILTGSSAGVAGCETLRSAYDAQIHNVLLHSHTSGESIPALELDRDKSWTASSDPMPKEGLLLQFDKTPTLRDEFLSSAKSSLFSGRSLESLPRDDDVLASILGRRSNPFKVLPTPKAPKPPKPSGANALMKQPKSALKSILKKRKVEIDAFTVLHGDVIRQQLANADDIQRDRRKAPCTRREVWSFIREIEGQENFDEPTVLGIPSDLHDLYHDILNGFESKLSPPALNGVVKGEQGTESNRVTLDARFEADSHGICLNKDPFESDAIHSSHVSVDSVHENAGNLVLPQEVAERNEDLVGGFREHANNDMHIHNTSGQPKEGMETDMSTEQLNEKMGRDSSTEGPKEDIGIDSSTEQAKENMQIDGSIVQPEEDKRIENPAEQPNEGVAEEPRGDSQFTLAQAVSSKTLEVNNIDTSTEPQASQGHVTSILVAMDKDAHEQVPQEVTAIEVGLDGKGRGEGEITISNIPENLVSIVGAEVDQQDRDVGETEKNLKERQQHSSVLLPVEGASEGGVLLLSKAMEVPCDAMDGIEMPISLAGGMPISQAIEAPISHAAEIGQGLQATGIPISQASEVPVSHTMDIDDGHVENSNIDLPSNGLEENKILCGYNQDIGTLESERNTGFLDDDNDDVVYAEMDYSGDEQSASVADDHGWSARSRNVGKYLKTVFEEMESSSKGVEHAEHVTLGLERLLARKTRREAARMFFETLVLKTKDYIHVQQNLAYADIHLYPKPKLMKTDF